MLAPKVVGHRKTMKQASKVVPTGMAKTRAEMVRKAALTSLILDEEEEDYSQHSEEQAETFQVEHRSTSNQDPPASA